jgi:outer membrane protein TolC
VATAERISLEECLRRVVAYNEALQVRALEWLANEHRLKAARGIFEPEVVASYERVSNERPNNLQQQASLLATPYLDELNNLYSGGLEFLAPTGGKLRVGYTLRDLRNNLQERFAEGVSEFETFTGITLTQPLLKNGGSAATLAAIRLAAGESELAFQEYRRQLMLALGRSEAAYWDLFFTQEQFRIRGESVRIAETLLRDNQLRLQTGKSSELEVLQAEAGVSLRLARQHDARQKLVEAQNRLTSLFSGSGPFTNLVVRAADQPELTAVQLNFFEGMREALELNPDYLAQHRQVVQENIRVAYAKNQRWPQLDLKASYGVNGLGDSPGASWDQAASSEFETWSVGVELRVPITGGVKGRHELAAAKARRQQALLNLKSVEVEISNALDTSLKRVVSTSESVTNYAKVVDFNQQLLENELARLDVGKTDSRKVLEIEETLSEARTTELENLVNFQKSRVEWALIRGAMLRERQLEVSRTELERRTAGIMRGRSWNEPQYANLRRTAGQEYDALARAQDEQTDRLREAAHRRLREVEAAGNPPR